MLHIGRNANDVSLSDRADGAAFFAVAAFARKNEQNLSARMLVPIRAGARLEGHVADRAIELVSTRGEHREVRRSRKVLPVGIEFALLKNRVVRGRVDFGQASLPWSQW